MTPYFLTLIHDYASILFNIAGNNLDGIVNFGCMLRILAHGIISTLLGADGIELRLGFTIKEPI
jgi:hypothetical protein